jgi:hypothetical protein
VVVRSYYGDHFEVNPQLLRGSFLVGFGLDTLPLRSDRTVDCSRPGADCELVTLVAIIFRFLHKVTVTGSLTVPGADIGQTHSGSLEGKSTITAWKPWRVNPQLLRGSLHQGVSPLSRSPL